MISMKIYIFCGGPSSEHDVSLASAQEIYTHIDHTKYDVSLFYLNTNLQAAILAFGPGKDAVSSAISNLDKNSCLPLDSVLSQLTKEDKPYLAFIAAMHGEFGEDGTLQKILEDKNIPYTGSTSQSSSLAFDKSRALKEIAHVKGLHTPTSTRFTKEHKDSQTIFPVIVKPKDNSNFLELVDLRHPIIEHEQEKGSQGNFSWLLSRYPSFSSF